MPLPYAPVPPTGWVPPQYLIDGYSGAQSTPGFDLAGAIEQVRQQQMMAGQPPIPTLEEYGGDPKQYLQLLATNDYGLATNLAGSMGLDINTLMQEAQSAGYYEGGQIGGFGGKLLEGVADTGRFLSENPALLFGAPLAIGAIGGAFAGGSAGAGGGSAGVGSGGGLTGVTLPSTAVPTGAVAGGLGPSVPAAAGAATVGPAIAGSASTIAPAVVGGAGTMPNWVNWANLGSTVLGVVGADRAADAQVAGSQAAIDESRRQYDTTRADFQPAIKLLGESAGALSRYNSGDTSGFFESPEYQYNLEQTTKAGERALSAMGLRQSGTMVKEAQRNATGLASRESSKFVDRLLAAAGLGTTGAAATSNAGANSAAMVGNASMNAGNARASGYANQYGALQGGVTNLLLSRYLGRGGP